MKKMRDEQTVRNLISRYTADVKVKKLELDEAEKELNALKLTLHIFELQGLQSQAKMFEVASEPENDKYVGKKIRECVLNIIGSYGGDAITSTVIYNELIAGGYTSKSKDIKRDVLIILNRMDGTEVVSEKRGNRRYYILGAKIKA